MPDVAMIAVRYRVSSAQTFFLSVPAVRPKRVLRADDCSASVYADVDTRCSRKRSSYRADRRQRQDYNVV